MPSEIIRWGIIGLGKIAHKFAQDLGKVPGNVLYGVASRDAAKAQDFAKQYQASVPFGSYEALMASPEIDVVYIATPHSEHYANSIACLRQGKAVLCEKPLAINSRQVRAMVEEARQQRRFLMEALWTFFLPHIHKTLEIIANDGIGELRIIKADFGFAAPYLPEGRIFNPALGGGSLLDVGIYPVFLSLLLFGRPTEIMASANIGPSGVDEDCSVILHFHGGQRALLHSSINASTPTEADIIGSTGRIRIAGRFHEPTRHVTLYPNGQGPQIFLFDYSAHGYNYEIAEVADCLRRGALESENMSWDFSLLLMETLDRIREHIGLRYPADEA